MARDKHLADDAAPAPSQQIKPLTNDDVVALTKAGLGAEIIFSKVSTAPATQFDTSVDALLRLKKEGVGNAVIDAMVKQPERAAASRPVSEKRALVTKAFQVRVTSNPDAVKGCKSMGAIHAETHFGGTGAITRNMQEQALARGANFVLMTGSITAVTDTHTEGNSEAYACIDP